MICFGLVCVLVLCGMAYCSGSIVEIKTAHHVYNVSDTVRLTCHVKSDDWLYVVIQRNGTDIYDCYSVLNGCIPTDEKPASYGSMRFNSSPTLIINNVTLQDSDVTFTCKWTSYADTIAFYVQERTTNTTSHTIKGRIGGYSLTVGLAVGLPLVCIGVIAELVLYVHRKPICKLERNNGTDTYGNGTRQMDSSKEEVTIHVESDPLTSIENNTPGLQT